MHNVTVIFTTFLIAFILTLLPMPEWTIWLRPAWVLMVLIFWIMVTPYRINVGVAWLIGIFLDVLHGTLIGEHALAFTIIAYIVTRIQTRFYWFPLSQQGLIVFFLVLFYQAILYCIQGFLGELPRSTWYWAASVTSMLLWPWIFIIMNDCRRRFRVT